MQELCIDDNQKCVTKKSRKNDGTKCPIAVQHNQPYAGSMSLKTRTPPRPFGRSLRPLAALALLVGLSACHANIFDPAGDIAQRQAHLVLLSTWLMLLIIVPVMVLTVLFAWRYRATNEDATYDPEWHHSTQLELVIWSAPLAIIIALGSVTWLYTHTLDPFRPLDRISEGKPLAAGAKVLDIDVVALDWKWLFIYPEQGVASVNELALPTDRPIRFHITSASVMNSFYIPALAGQIYAMPGMTSELNAVLNKPGTYVGFSANYSGAGFSQMHFKTLGYDQSGFDSWVKTTRAGSGNLDANTYLTLEAPSIAEPVHHYASVQADLFDKIVNLCVRSGKMCQNQMAAIDARGGAGKAGLFNVAQLSYDKFGRESVSPVLPSQQAALNASLTKAFVRAMCAPGQEAKGVLAAKPPIKAPLKAEADLSLATPRSPLS